MRPHTSLFRRIFSTALAATLALACATGCCRASEQAEAPQQAAETTEQTDTTQPKAAQTEYDGFEPNETVELGPFSVQVPTYYSSNAKRGTDRYGLIYAAPTATGDGVFQLFYFVDDGDGATYADNLAWYFNRLAQSDGMTDLSAAGDATPLSGHELEGCSQTATLKIKG